MKFLKLQNSLSVLFSKVELEGLFKSAKKQELAKEMARRGLSFNDLRRDYSKLEEIASIVGEKGAQDRDDHEIFAALFIFFRFYEKDSEIGFELDNRFNPRKDQINTLADLNKFRKGNAESDFLIKSRDGVRKFQLKRYRDNMSTQAVTDFINKKLSHYGNGLNGTNLLIVLQPPKAYMNTKIEFTEIHNKLTSLNLQLDSEILIAYNQADRSQLVIQVYPELKKVSVPVVPPSAQ